MKCILLCAGYATRLFPLTENFPKALLEVGNKPILNYIIEKVNKIEEVDEIYLVSNSKYYEHFEKWGKTVNSSVEITVVDDGTKSVDDRLGAIGDTMYVIDKYKVSDDLLIVAGDSLFEYELTDFVDYYKEKKSPCVVGQIIEELEYLKGMGVAEVDSNDKLLAIEEKPENPKSNIATWAVYLYPKDVLPLFNTYKEEGYLLDSPGNFLTYLYKVKDTYVFMTKEKCFDVGTHKALEEVNKLYS